MPKLNFLIKSIPDRDKARQIQYQYGNREMSKPTFWRHLLSKNETENKVVKSFCLCSNEGEKNLRPG